MDKKHRSPIKGKYDIDLVFLEYSLLSIIKVDGGWTDLGLAAGKMSISEYVGSLKLMYDQSA